MMTIPNCKLYTGYKPCEPFKTCRDCRDEVPIGTGILIINLDALGDVLVTTATLPAMKRKYPQSIIHWLTKQSAQPLLENNPYLDRVWLWNDESRLILSEMKFDVLFCADKNQNSCAFVNKIQALEKYGFGCNENGAIIPLNESAEYNYRMGLEDRLKFKLNERSGQDILAETFELPFERDEYVLHLSESEEREVEELQNKYGLRADDFVVGFNTGCAKKFPHKKLTVAQHIDLINRLGRELPEIKLVLLGGREDTERNSRIAENVTVNLTSTPTEEGLRRGVLFEAMCDLIVSGDSLGMHIGIALKKLALAWFGMTSHQEIDLYDRGEKIVSTVHCSPCWSSVCLPGNLECIHQLDMDEFLVAIQRIYQRRRNE
ncbi:MAG TPA: lipopolysaccharide heptosyltransferase family protein [Bacteroidetes bacterium]|nr:lipopolysaccharide heptosyltransferase family protein [Bacteroidota bacterium]